MESLKDLIGRTLIDSDGAECEIVDATSSSINVLIKAKTKAGITATNWFLYNDRKFSMRFKLKE